MIRLALLVALVGCGSSPATTAITVTPPDPLPSQARAIVWLWGADDTLADAGASLIEAYDQPIAGPAFVIDVPDNPHELIDQGHGPVAADRALFYFDVFVDLDGNGQLCPGDLRQDFDLTDFQSFSAPPTSIDVALAAIESDRPCQPIVP